MQHTGQQWDFPNGWPPLQSLMVTALENTGNPRAKDLAFRLAQKWVRNNFEAYQQSMPNAMFEKVINDTIILVASYFFKFWNILFSSFC